MKRLNPILLSSLSALMLGVALWLVFGFAPIESQMGYVQKIFYFHVPSAYSMYLSWTICTVASVLWIVKRHDKWDILASSAAEVALMFSAMVMITGPLWGRKAWGAYWTWDPRLTSALILTIIISSYVLLRALGKGETERRFSAALSIVGAAVMVIVHYSVQLWRGQHPTVIGKGGGGLSPDMAIVFGFCMLTFTVIVAALITYRYRSEKMKRAIGALEQKILHAEDGEKPAIADEIDALLARRNAP